MKKAVSILIMAITAAVLSVCASAENTFTYEVKSDGTAAITGNNAPKDKRDPVLIIPSVIDGYTVTELKTDSFSYSQDIERVEIPSSVTVIGKRAFADCYSLSEIDFSEGLLSIGEDTFRCCTYVTEINIPDSVTFMGDGAFSGCSCINSVDTGDGLTVISDNAFAQCYALSRIKLGENVKEIGDYAFIDCYISEIYIPASLKKVGDDAFDPLSDCVINYSGSKASWKSIDFGSDNYSLKNAEINFFTDAYGNTDKSFKSVNAVALSLYIAAALLVVVLGIVFAVRGGDRTKCPHCRAEREEGAEFCGNCGSKL